MTAEDKSKNSELEKGPTEKQEETFRRAKEVYKQVRRISTNEWDAKGPKSEKKRRFIQMGNGLARTAAQSMSIRTGKTIIENRKSTKTSAKTGVKNCAGSYELDGNKIPKPIYCPKCNGKEDRLLLVKIKKGEVLTLD